MVAESVAEVARCCVCELLRVRGLALRLGSRAPIQQGQPAL